MARARPAKRGWVFLASGLAAVVALFVAVVVVSDIASYYAMPSILRGAKAGGASRCSVVPGLAGTAYETGLKDRVARQFPRGSSAPALKAYLILNGFEYASAFCPSDRALETAVYREKPSLDPAKPSVFASVTWKEDARGALLWTDAQLSYTGM